MEEAGAEDEVEAGEEETLREADLTSRGGTSRGKAGSLSLTSSLTRNSIFGICRLKPRWS